MKQFYKDNKMIFIAYLFKASEQNEKALVISYTVLLISIDNKLTKKFETYLST